MFLRALLRRALSVLLPLALCSTFYLYLYPIFHGCAFPSTDGSFSTSFNDTIRQHFTLRGNGHSNESVTLAPFRLLVLADPQLEGDSSLPDPEDGFIPRLRKHWTRLRQEHVTFDDPPISLQLTAGEMFLHDIPQALQALRKRLDLFGNDFYLAHIFRTLYWWTKPTHIAVLGDLIGSQWVTDDEFEWRGWRYWNRVFKGGRRVEDEITRNAGEAADLGMYEPSWRNRIINIAGNHDIGYAGDISKARMERFERVFGTANWDVRFEHEVRQEDESKVQSPTLHLVVLNTLNLDTPALDEDLQHESYEWLNTIMNQKSRPVEDRSSFTLLLTHLPLHKEEGICVDGPWFDFWGDDDGGGVYTPHGVKEQNHLSQHASQHGVLGGIFGMNGKNDAPAGGRGRNGLILTGHDHEGCDVWHYIPEDRMMLDEEEGQSDSNWQAAAWKNANITASHTGIREVTLRSMMGDFGGNAGLLSAWFDFDVGEWKYDIQMCKFGVQHLWWAVHVLDIVAFVCLLAWTLLPAEAAPQIVRERIVKHSKS